MWLCVVSADVNECEVLDPCQNGAEWRNMFGSYECICQPGFTGKNCETGKQLLQKLLKGEAVKVVTVMIDE